MMMNSTSSKRKAPSTTTTKKKKTTTTTTKKKTKKTPKLVTTTYDASTAIALDDNKKFFNIATKTNRKRVNLDTLERLSTLDLMSFLARSKVRDLPHSLRTILLTVAKAENKKNSECLERNLKAVYPSVRTCSIMEFERDAKDDHEAKLAIRQQCAFLCEMGITLSLGYETLASYWRSSSYEHVASVKVSGVQRRKNNNGKIIVRFNDTAGRKRAHDHLSMEHAYGPTVAASALELNTTLDADNDVRTYVAQITKRDPVNNEQVSLALGLQDIPKDTSAFVDALGPLAINTISSVIAQYLFNYAV